MLYGLGTGHQISPFRQHLSLSLPLSMDSFDGFADKIGTSSPDSSTIAEQAEGTRLGTKTAKAEMRRPYRHRPESPDLLTAWKTKQGNAKARNKKRSEVPKYARPLTKQGDEKADGIGKRFPARTCICATSSGSGARNGKVSTRRRDCSAAVARGRIFCDLFFFCSSLPARTSAYLHGREH
jgi:hypothetical protein